jgi:hypothetical protein
LSAAHRAGHVSGSPTSTDRAVSLKALDGGGRPFHFAGKQNGRSLYHSGRMRSTEKLIKKNKGCFAAWNLLL